MKDNEYLLNNIISISNIIFNKQEAGFNPYHNIRDLVLGDRLKHLGDIAVENLKKGKHTVINYEFKPITEEELISKLGRKWKVTLLSLLKLIDQYQYLCIKEKGEAEVTIIPTNGYNLLQVFNSSANISNLIKKAEQIQLINTVSDYHSYVYNIAKLYAYNKEVEYLIKDICKKYDIRYDVPKFIIRNNVQNAEEKEIIFELPINIKSKYRISSNIGRLHDGLTDQEITQILYANYPQLRYCHKLADELNTKLPEEEQIKFKPKVTRSRNGFITKIGIRATNRIVSLKEHFDNLEEEQLYDGAKRSDYLNKKFGYNNWFEFDVKASIYRVTTLLNTGVWLDNNIDIYEHMMGRPFKDKSERAAYKRIAMRLYFSRSKADCFCKIEKFLKEKVAEYDEHTNTLMGFCYKDINELFNRETVYQAYDRMTDVLHQRYDSEVFLHESCIYLMFMYKLMNKYNLLPTQIYDGFYFNKDVITQKEIESLMTEVAESYYEKFINKENNVIELTEAEIEEIDNRIKNLGSNCSSSYLNELRNSYNKEDRNCSKKCYSNSYDRMLFNKDIYLINLDNYKHIVNYSIIINSLNIRNTT